MARHTLIEQGTAALEACDWPAARSCFTEALAREETAEALDGLGQARYWEGAYDDALPLRERAYARYRQQGARRPAARTAVQLAMLHGLINGNGAAVSGWLGHARRALEGDGDGVEAGWVVLFEACITGDPVEREQRARQALSIARRAGHPPLEYDALCYIGKALVEQGAVGQGMRLVDEAIAALTCGMVTDAWATAEILCTLYHACEIALDVRRAEEWLGLVDRHVERTGELPIFGVCRMHYGGLLTAAGRWADAERELLAAIECYDAGYRGTRFEPVLRLADLRARQGRVSETRRLLDGYEELPAAVVPRARLHLLEGEPRLAAALIERHVAEGSGELACAPSLALLAEALVRDGRRERAARVVRELAACARRCGHGPVEGLAALAQARLTAGEGGGSAPGAATIAAFERAMSLFAEADLVSELACARIELARCLASAEPRIARAEARAALAAFEKLGAAADADAAAALLRELGDTGRSRRADGRRAPGRHGATDLTVREREVLEVLALGATNAEIAERLFISPRTAEHHVGNILRKLDLRNRAEAAACLVRSPELRVRT